MRFVNLAEVISYRAVLREYPGGFQIFFGLIVKEAASAYELGVKLSPQPVAVWFKSTPRNQTQS